MFWILRFGKRSDPGKWLLLWINCCYLGYFLLLGTGFWGQKQGSKHEQIPRRMRVRIPLVRLSELLQETLRRTIFSCLLWLQDRCRNCRLPVFFQDHFPGLRMHNRDHGAGNTCM